MHSEMQFEDPEGKPMHLPFHREWKWRADLDAVNAYEDEFVSLLQHAKDSWLSADDIPDCALGFREALIDAIRYGTSAGKDGEVTIEVAMSANELRVTITDTNTVAFNPDIAFNAVTDDTQILAKHGRGIFMMRTLYPDGVTFEFLNPGNKVTMIRRKKEE